MKSVVLFSGGMDSTVALKKEVDHWTAPEVLALTVLYGQKHYKEAEAAAKITELLGVKHRIVKLPNDILSGSKLTDATSEVPRVSYEEIEGLSPLYVPFRNGLFISIAAAIAVQVGATHVVIAAHASDHEREAYPDCSPAFARSMGSAIYLGTGESVMLYAPFIHLSKASVASWGKKCNAPMQLSWSCYVGGDEPCGTCPTCRDRQAALEAAGLGYK